MQDLLEDNGVGYTVPPDDPSALAELLIELDDDPEHMKILGENVSFFWSCASM